MLYYTVSPITTYPFDHHRSPQSQKSIKKNLIFWVEGQLRNLVWLINYLNMLWMKSLILGDFRNANPNFSHSIKTAKYRSPLFRGIMDLWCIIWLQIRPTFIGKWIKGCLTFSDFSCLMLGQEQIPVQP